MTNSILSATALEEWRDILGYEGYYQVSNLGRVRSLDRSARNKNGVLRSCKGRVLSPKICSGGYLGLSLYLFDKQKCFQVHTLVAQAFLGVRPDGYDVNHIDGCKTNNLLQNLEYCTRSENVRHAYRNHLNVSKKGEDHYSAKLTESQVRQIRSRVAAGESQRAIAREFGLNNMSVSLLVRRKNWSHVI